MRHAIYRARDRIGGRGAGADYSFAAAGIRSESVLENDIRAFVSAGCSQIRRSAAKGDVVGENMTLRIELEQGLLGSRGVKSVGANLVCGIVVLAGVWAIHSQEIKVRRGGSACRDSLSCCIYPSDSLEGSSSGLESLGCRGGGSLSGSGQDCSGGRGTDSNGGLVSLGNGGRDGLGIEVCLSCGFGVDVGSRGSVRHGHGDGS